MYQSSFVHSSFINRLNELIVNFSHNLNVDPRGQSDKDIYVIEVSDKA